MCYVYAIGAKDDLAENNFDFAYIGVSVDPERRWNQHMVSKYTVGTVLRAMDWKFNDNLIILFEGTEDECFEIENMLRPKDCIGLNISVGGHGGYTKYTKERGKKISEKLRGIKRTDETKKKISESKVGVYDGIKNPNAKKWIFVSPDGTEYEIIGGYEKFCKEKDLVYTALIKHRGERVPEISPKFRGDDISRKRRINTINWLLKEDL